MILMAERTPDAPQRQAEPAEPICASCHRRLSWCQSTQVQRKEPHEFNAVPAGWDPVDAAGLDGRPDGWQQRQVREALSGANVLTDEERAERIAARRRRPEPETGEEVTG